GSYLTPRNQQIVEAVIAAADGLGWSPIEVALTWVRDRPGITAPIVGARTAAQLKASLDQADLTLPPELVDARDDVSAGDSPDDRRGSAGPASRRGVGVRPRRLRPRTQPQRGDPPAGRTRRTRWLGARPGPDRPRRQAPGGPAPQDHPAATRTLAAPLIVGG